MAAKKRTTKPRPRYQITQAGIDSLRAQVEATMVRHDSRDLALEDAVIALTNFANEGQPLVYRVRQSFYHYQGVYADRLMLGIDQFKVVP